MKKIGFLLAFILISLAIIPFALAHQPRVVMDKANSLSDPFIVAEPEISKAFYGELKENPNYYLINSEVDFELYLNILSPYPHGERDFSVEVFYNNDLTKPLFTLFGNGFNWTNFYEEFGGDNYWMGPELDKNVSGGSYLIKVYNINNSGKYSLAIGKIEAFPFNEQIKAFLAMPELKSKFFGKNPFKAYFNKIGFFFLIFLLIILLIIYGLFLFIRKMMHKKKKK